MSKSLHEIKRFVKASLRGRHKLEFESICFMSRTCSDRQAGTESDGYTEDEKLRLSQAWLQAACPDSVANEDDEVESTHQHTTMR